MKTLLPWTLVAVLSVALLIAAQDGGQEKPAQGQPSGRGGFSNDMSAKMIQAIQETEGCLEVTTGRLSSNRDAIFAFFKDRQAALRWYHHPMHQHLRGMMGDAPVGEAFEPLKDVPEGVPVLTVASISFAGEPAMPGSQIPFSSISIELYVPVNGGLRINGGFAPEKFAELARATTVKDEPK